LSPQKEAIAVDDASISEAQLSLLESTWTAAKGLGVETVGVLLFKNIFTAAPEALALFSFKDEADLYESVTLKAHGVKVVTTVDVAVSTLRDLPALVPVLQELALKHVGYGVLAAHYPVVGAALIKTLKDGLGEAWTSEVEAAWLKVWGLISSTMIAATTKEPESEPVVVAETPAAETPAAETDELGEKHFKLVEDTWKTAAGLGVETVGVLLFKNIFTAAPEALALFPFKDEKDLYESSSLKGHGVKVVTTVDVAVSKLRDLPTLVPVLQELALKHVGYGVLPAHYPVVGGALIKTLKDGLGEAWTAEVEAAWLKVWGLISSTMLGAVESKAA